MFYRVVVRVKGGFDVGFVFGKGEKFAEVIKKIFGFEFYLVVVI